MIINRPVRTVRFIPRDFAERVGVPFTGTPIEGVVQVMVDEHWIMSPIDKEWTAYLRIVNQDGQPVVAEVRIFPYEDVQPAEPGQWSVEALGLRAKAPRGGIRARVIRKVRLQPLLESLTGLIHMAQHDGEFRTRHKLDDLLTTFDPKTAKGHRGRPGKPDLFYAELGAQYADLLRRKNLKPITTLASQLHLKPPKVRDMIREARKRGFLTEGDPGRPKGQLTPAGWALLKAKQTDSVKGVKKDGRQRPRKAKR